VTLKPGILRPRAILGLRKPFNREEVVEVGRGRAVYNYMHG
jgi:hypothetical protein